MHCQNHARCATLRAMAVRGRTPRGSSVTRESDRASAALLPYAPRTALEMLADDTDARWRRVVGTLGFFDLSGFTRLAERLGKAGKVGAETVSAIVDGVYS